ncbi:hypothetical protein L596_004797 [Steinernema carpocapsae]|uniref:Uncharacterized protein n=1 Tax=Steinernema carpocapsae TaxID=34508 RepID=A0A4U8UYI0_STECR|nr:hypothetical protein L596_004797 [Steinernema carpocapsae]
MADFVDETEPTVEEETVMEDSEEDEEEEAAALTKQDKEEDKWLQLQRDIENGLQFPPLLQCSLGQAMQTYFERMQGLDEEPELTISSQEQPYYDRAFQDFEKRYGLFCRVDKRYIRIDENRKLDPVGTLHAARMFACPTTALMDGRIVMKYDPDCQIIDLMAHTCCPRDSCLIQDYFEGNLELSSYDTTFNVPPIN